MAFNWKNDIPVNIETVRGWLEAGRKVILYIRHGERPPISPDDPSFGASLELTSRGRECALNVGRGLKGAVHGIQLQASPMTRTRLTARFIAEGAGMGRNLPVEDSEEISVRNVFIDPLGVYHAMDREGVMHFTLSYIESGTAPYCRPVPEATRNALRYMEHDASSQLNVYCGHDFMIATALAGLHLAHYTEETWIPFLTGLVLVSTDEGGWKPHWFV